MTPDLTVARLAGASYQPDPSAAVSALGLSFVGHYGEPGCRALVARAPDGETIIAFEGTVLDLPDWRSWTDDAECIAVEAPGGYRVHEGFWRPLEQLWAVLGPLAEKGGPLCAVGHSAGGARAALTPLLAPHARVVAFGCPAPALPPWQAIGTFYVHARDPVPDWPLPPWGRPSPIIWLTDGVALPMPRRPFGLDLDIADHAIAAYADAMGQLVPA